VSVGLSSKHEVNAPPPWPGQKKGTVALPLVSQFLNTWGKRARRSFTEEFKAGAVRLVLDEGKAVAEAARALGLTASALGNWVKQARADRSGGKTGLTTAERDGTYSVTLPEGNHTLVVGYSGLDSARIGVTVSAGQTVTKDVQLSSGVYKMDVFSVSGVREGSAQGRMRRHLELEVAFESFRRAFAHQELVQVLQVGQAVEEQDALDQLVGVLHLVDRLVVLVLGEFLQAPVLQHLGVQEVLVDRGQLVVERLVEEFDDLGVALHGVAPVGCWTGRMLARRSAP
jgi:hypothetical protein